MSVRSIIGMAAVLALAGALVTVAAATTRLYRRIPRGAGAAADDLFGF